MTTNTSSLKTQSTNNIQIVFEADARTTTVHMHIDSWISEIFEGRAQNVLSFLDSMLKRKRRSMDDVSAIGVVMEGPSFTATRTMTVIANSFGFIKGIVLKTLSQEFSQSSDDKKTKLWQDAQECKVLVATYNAPPNITLKKV